MDDRRIKELANFFYSSNSSKRVPLRISISMGMSGSDLTYEGFIHLMEIFNVSINIQKDLKTFLKDNT